MRILISNDDGVLAPGLSAIANELSTIAILDIMAPDRNRSGASNSLTLLHPLRVRKLDNDYYSVDGTPTDCVHLAVTGFFSHTFDMVVSGINEGGNLGDDILYSGTVAAAMEGRNLGLPAIAISLVGTSHYATAAVITKQIILSLRDKPLPPQVIFNVNVPDLPLSEIKGIEVTRLGTRHAAESVLKERDPRGREIYWIGPPGAAADSGVGTDFFAISQQYVSVTPLQLDLTNYKVFDDVSTWINTNKVV